MADRRNSTVDHSIKEHLGKILNRTECVPKEKHVRAVIQLVCENNSVEPLIHRMAQLKRLGDAPVMTWKALGILHRALFVVGGTRVLTSVTPEGRAVVNGLGRSVGAHTHAFSKVTAILSQLLSAKFDFHSRHPHFNAGMSSGAAPALPESASHEEQFALLDDLFMYQQLCLNMCALVFSLAQSPAAALNADMQSCVAWPLGVVIEESIAVYDQEVELMFALVSAVAAKEQASGSGTTASAAETHMRVVRLQDQHRKLRRVYLQARSTPVIAANVEAPVLSEQPPIFDSEDARIAHAMRPEREVLRGEYDDLIAERATASGDARDRLIVEMRQKQKEQEAVINSLQSYMQEMVRDLTMVDPDTIAELAAAGGEGSDRTSLLSLQQRALRQELQRLQEELAMCRSTNDALEMAHDDTKQQLNVVSCDLAASRAAVAAGKSRETALTAALAETEAARARETTRADESERGRERDAEKALLVEATYAELTAEMETAMAAQAQELETATGAVSRAERKTRAVMEQAQAKFREQNEAADALQAQLVEAREKVVETLRTVVQEKARASELAESKGELENEQQRGEREAAELREAAALQSAAAATLQKELASEKARFEEQGQQLAQAHESLEALQAEVVAAELRAKESAQAAQVSRARVTELMSQAEQRQREAEEALKSVKATADDTAATRAREALAISVKQAQHLLTQSGVGGAEELLGAGIDQLHAQLEATTKVAAADIVNTVSASTAAAPSDSLQPVLLADGLAAACLTLEALTDGSGEAAGEANDAASEVAIRATSQLRSAGQAFFSELASLQSKEGEEEEEGTETQTGAPPSGGATKEALLLRERLEAAATKLRSALSDFRTAGSSALDSVVGRGSRLDGEMGGAAASVSAATERIAAMLEAARSDAGTKTLDVHGGILDASMLLMRLIGELMQTTGALQAEIVAAETTANGGGVKSAAQFYKRNSRWIDGLVSAAKAVGAGATVLVDTADGVVRGSAELEELMVAGQEIAASTAQLVTASRVKAPRTSANKAALEGTTKGVFDATKALIGAARAAGKEKAKVASAKDFLNLSVTQARRLEMDSQVRVLQLERELELEQARLRQLRRKQYQAAETVELKGNATTTNTASPPPAKPKPKPKPVVKPRTGGAAV